MMALIVLLCIKASYTDFKTGKVFNKDIVRFLLIGLALNVIYYCLSYKHSGFGYITEYFINVLIGGVVSFILYYLKTWGAGDAKLYFTIITLFPLNIYMNNSFNVFPGFMLLIVIFCLGFLYVFIETTTLFIKDLSMKRIGKGFVIAKGFNRHILKEIFWSLSFSYLFSSISFLLFTRYSPDIFTNNRGLFMFLNVLLISFLISRLKGKRMYFAVILLLAVFMVINIFIVQIRYMLSTATILSMAIFLFVILLRYIGSKYNYNEILAKDIEEGMILSLETVFKFKTSRYRGLPEYTTENTDSRLSSKEVEIIKKWANAMPGIERISIVKILPFAPFISIGTIVFAMIRIYMILFIKG